MFLGTPKHFNGDGTEYVGIRMGNNSKVAKYLVGNDKSSLNPASGEETLYWPDSSPAVIKAWFPYNDGTATYDISDCKQKSRVHRKW